jgi:WD40 repeat protein
MDMQRDVAAPVNIFYSYAHEDERYRDQLENHLSLLRRQGIISEWHDRKIIPGMDWAGVIDDHLQNASIILLLISPDFLASEYCYGIEMQRTLERHKTGNTIAIPILLRAVDWKDAPFAHLQCLPRNGKPIRTWRDRDAAFSEIAREIRLLIGQLRTAPDSTRSFSFSPGTFSSSTNERPRTYIPFPRNPLFQPRPAEFERLERLLFGPGINQQSARLGLVGVVGLGGVGKTQLAVELAYRCLDQQRFPAGMFWMPATGTSVFEWQHQFAELALNTDYLSPEDDSSNPENEARRARHFCRYLATHKDALLILDNVEDPNLVTSVLPVLAGVEVVCPILYTSRNQVAPPGVSAYPVRELPAEGALRLLLETTRPMLLAEVLDGSVSAEAQAARAVCQDIGYLPLALVHLRGLLARDQRLTLMRLVEVLKQRGALELAKTQQGDAAPLFATFRLSWEKIGDESVRSVFKLACYFPEAIPIPLWLLGLATGLGEQGDIFEPLGEACLHLQELSLLEELSGDQVRLHPLVREFGRRLVAEENHKGKAFLEAAAERLTSEFEDLNRLEQRARRKDYWGCLEQVRTAMHYLEFLGTDHVKRLARIERWLDRESFLFGDEQWWPKKLPGLLYQQLYNRSVEEGRLFAGDEAPTEWLRQMREVGAEDHSLLRIFVGHSDQVSSVAFSPDGQMVLTGSADGTARLWEMASGRQLGIVAGHSDQVSSVAFSPDGKLVLTGSWDKTARLWETGSGKHMSILAGHSDQVRSVAFSPDGRMVLTGSNDATVRLWETGSGKQIDVLEGHSGSVRSVAFSPDGKLVLTGSEDKTARLWEISSRKLLITFEGHSHWVNDAAFSPDGKLVLTGSADWTARLWETASGKHIITLEDYHGQVNSVAFSPDGRLVLTGSGGDQIARLWETTSGQSLAKFEGHDDWVSSVAFSPDGRMVLTGSADGTARLWEIGSGKQVGTLEGHSDQVSSVAFSPDGKLVLTGSWDKMARLWVMGSGKQKGVLEGHSDQVSSVAFSPDGKLVLTGSWDKTARLWETTSGKFLTGFEGHDDRVYDVMFSPDGKLVLTGSYDETACLWETSTGRQVRSLNGHTSTVNHVAFSPDGRLVLTGSWDKTARLWETGSGKQVGVLEGHSDFVSSVAFSPDGRLVLTGSADGTARLWETSSGKQVGSLEGHSGPVYNVAFSPDGKLALTCGGYGRVFFWQVMSPGEGRLLGLYVAAYEAGAIYWQDPTNVVLADLGGAHFRPHFYYLKLEGTW